MDYIHSLLASQCVYAAIATYVLILRGVAMGEKINKTSVRCSVRSMALL